MDTSDYARIKPARGQLVRDADIQRRAPTINEVDFFDPRLREAVSLIAYTRPEGFTELAKAIAPGNLTLQNQILRVWGIRG